jgi:hypothetical protein
MLNEALAYALAAERNERAAGMAAAQRHEPRARGRRWSELRRPRPGRAGRAAKRAGPRSQPAECVDPVGAERPKLHPRWSACRRFEAAAAGDDRLGR